MTTGLVATVLSIPLSCFLRVSFSEPPQDLSLNPWGSRIGRILSFSSTQLSEDTEAKGGDKAGCLQRTAIAHLLYQVSVHVRAQLHFNYISIHVVVVFLFNQGKCFSGRNVRLGRGE